MSTGVTESAEQRTCERKVRGSSPPAAPTRNLPYVLLIALFILITHNGIVKTKYGEYSHVKVNV